MKQRGRKTASWWNASMTRCQAVRKENSEERNISVVCACLASTPSEAGYNCWKRNSPSPHDLEVRDGGWYSTGQHTERPASELTQRGRQPRDGKSSDTITLASGARHTCNKLCSWSTPSVGQHCVFVQASLSWVSVTCKQES